MTKKNQCLAKNSEKRWKTVLEKKPMIKEMCTIKEFRRIKDKYHIVLVWDNLGIHKINVINKKKMVYYKELEILSPNFGYFKMNWK